MGQDNAHDEERMYSEVHLNESHSSFFVLINRVLHQGISQAIDIWTKMETEV